MKIANKIIEKLPKEIVVDKTESYSSTLAYSQRRFFIEGYKAGLYETAQKFSTITLEEVLGWLEIDGVELAKKLHSDFPNCFRWGDMDKRGKRKYLHIASSLATTMLEWIKEK